MSFGIEGWRQTLGKYDDDDDDDDDVLLVALVVTKFNSLGGYQINGDVDRDGSLYVISTV